MADLVDLDINPAPPGGICGEVRPEEGVSLRYARWPTPYRPLRGTVLVLQGRAEFIEKYFETVGDLQRRGFAAATFDWRGQGGSTRSLRNPRKGHVDDFSSYVRDLRAVVDDVLLPDCPPPYYVLAHSTGGAVALLNAVRARTQIERMVVTAPLLGLGHGLDRWRGLARALNGVGLGTWYVPGGGSTLMNTQPFARNPVTSDQRRYGRAGAVLDSNPALGSGSATISWANAAFRTMRAFAEPEFVERVPVPVLMLIGGRDTIVSNRSIERLSSRLKTAGHVWIPGAMHEIMMERDAYREQFWAAFDAFIPGP